MTTRQREVLDFIGAFIATERHSPSYEEIADWIGVRSVATVHKHLSALVRSGNITRVHGVSRSVDMARPEISSRGAMGAVIAERERCAKVCESMNAERSRHARNILDRAAAKIRSK